MDETEPSEQSPDEFFLTAALFESLLAVLALFLGWAIGPSARAMIPESAELWRIATGLAYGIAAAIPALLFIEVVRRIPLQAVRDLERFGDDGIMKTLLSLRPSELIVISICAGVGEELLFRGWLMYGLAEFAESSGATSVIAIAIALVISSTLFGLIHPITKLYVVLAALIGLYFGALVIFTENLLVPIAAHATYDAVQLLMGARSKQQTKSPAQN